MSDRVAAVLGVGPGLGAAVGRRFAGGGFGLALMARSEESVAGVREELEGGGGTALPVSADATDPYSLAAAFELVRDKLGDPEVFVYNAGAFQMGGILDLSPEQFDTCFPGRTARGLSTRPGRCFRRWSRRGAARSCLPAPRRRCVARRTFRGSRSASSVCARSRSPWRGSSGRRGYTSRT